VTYDGSDLGQEADEHDPGIARVMPSDVDNEAAEVMTVLLNVDHFDVQEGNNLVESVPNTPAELQEIESPPEPHVEHMNDNYDNSIFDHPTIGNEVDPMEDVVSATTIVEKITEQHSMAEDMDNRYDPHSARYHLRNRRKPNYGHWHHISHGKSVRSTDGFYAARHMLFTQHHVGNGLRIFGSRGENAVIKELSQLHMCNVLEPQIPEELTPTEKAAALAYLMFLKETRTGEIKGRWCADG